MKLRLITNLDCYRNCEGCCNETGYWKDTIDNLPFWDGKGEWDEIILTGGEPLMHVRDLLWDIYVIKEMHPTTPIYVYTAGSGDAQDTFRVLEKVHGITLTLHSQRDLVHLRRLNDYIKAYHLWDRALRLNVIDGVIPTQTDTLYWNARSKTFTDDCPLPDGEILMKGYRVDNNDMTGKRVNNVV